VTAVDTAVPDAVVRAITKRRRTTELGLLILAIIIVGGAYTLVSFGRNTSLSAEVSPFLGVVVGLVIVAHIVNRKFAPASDGLLLPLAALLNGIGYVFIARLDQDLAAIQATWTAIGIALYIATLVLIRDYRWLAKYPYTWALIGVTLLVVPLLPGI
jgi:hypothetical protein